MLPWLLERCSQQKLTVKNKDCLHTNCMTCHWQSKGKNGTATTWKCTGKLFHCLGAPASGYSGAPGHSGAPPSTFLYPKGKHCVHYTALFEHWLKQCAVHDIHKWTRRGWWLTNLAVDLIIHELVLSINRRLLMSCRTFLLSVWLFVYNGHFCSYTINSCLMILYIQPHKYLPVQV